MTPPEKNVPPAEKKEPFSRFLLGFLTAFAICAAFAAGRYFVPDDDDDSAGNAAESRQTHPLVLPSLPSIPDPALKLLPVPAAPPQEQPAPPAEPQKPAPVNAGGKPATETPAVSPEKSGTTKLEIQTEPETHVTLIQGEKKRVLGEVNATGKLVIDENLPVDGKPLSLLLHNPRYFPERRDDVNLPGGRTTVVNVPLRPRPGAIAIVVEPASAEVRFDGVLVGRGFVTIGGVSSKKPHTVEVSIPDRTPVKRTVIIKPDETHFERVTLVPEKEPAGDGIPPAPPVSDEAVVVKTLPETLPPAAAATPGEPQQKSRILSLSKIDGIAAIAPAPGVVVKKGQDIRFQSTGTAALLRVVEVGPTLILCQVLSEKPGTPLPETGDEGTVTSVDEPDKLPLPAN